MNSHPIENWLRLRKSGEGDGALDVPSISSDVETGYGHARFAVGPNGEPRLLVPVGPGTQGIGALSAGKLAVRISRYTLNGRSALFLDVLCLERQLDPAFAEIADEILHRIGSGVAPARAVEDTISDFRELLQDAARSSVDEARVIGLIGELVVLDLLCEISPGAIEAWTGPFDQRHDFRRRTQALEVKTSTRADATSIVVSSIEQLTEPAGGALTLIHLRMERAVGGLSSIGRLARRILERGVVQEELLRRLSAAGCANWDAPEWNGIELSIEGMAGYRVVPGFPRINTGLFQGNALPAGITSVSYGVDLAAANQFRMEEYGLQAAMQGVAL